LRVHVQRLLVKRLKRLPRITYGADSKTQTEAAKLKAEILRVVH
jgi:hypothetical protein